MTRAYQVPLEALEDFSPFESIVWDTDSPVRRAEVVEALKADRLFAPGQGEPGSRAEHVGRIAWLVRYGWSDPIELDVGAPFLHWHNPWWVMDGNHRHAAAIIQRRTHIAAWIAGDLDYAAATLNVEI